MLRFQRGRSLEYDGSYKRNLVGDIVNRGTLPFLVLGLLIVGCLILFIYYELNNCNIFCVRLDGPDTYGEPHCNLELPATVQDDGIDPEFVARVLEVGSQVQRNNRIILCTVWLPKGYFTSDCHKFESYM